jgi:large repetitive protein
MKSRSGFGRIRILVGLLLAAIVVPACGGDGKTRTNTVTVPVPVPTYDPPLAFALTAPINGDPLVPTTPTFSWNTALGAFSYRLQVSTMSDFSALVIDQAGLTTTSYQPPAPLEGSMTHWWRVIAVNGTATTPSTAPERSFTTVSASNRWETVGSDVRHSGYNAAETGVPPLTFAWNSAHGSAALKPVAYEGGMVFVTGTTTLYAVNASTGITQWSKNFGSVFSVGQPSVFNGAVYVGQCNHSPGTFLWSFNAATGAQRWTAPVGAQWENYWAPIVVGNSVYMNGGYYGGLYGFNTGSGAELFFNNQLEQYDEWSPAYDNNTLYSFVSGKLRFHNPATGAIQQTVSVTWNWAGWSMRTCPVVGAGRVYVIAPPVLYAINPSTLLVDWQTSGFNFTGMPAVAGTSVYAITGGTLHSRNAATGAFQWSFAGDTQLNKPPVVAAGHVFVSSDANVYAVRVSDGVQAWTTAVGGWLTVASGKLFIARINGVLTAYTLTP